MITIESTVICSCDICGEKKNKDKFFESIEETVRRIGNINSRSVAESFGFITIIRSNKKINICEECVKDVKIELEEKERI